jgi:nucleoid DNA-binding protein
MTPKKPSDLYRQVSEDLNYSESLIEDLVEFFYKDLKENLVSLKHPRINVLGLGHFEVKRYMVNKHIEKYKKVLLTHDTKTYSSYFNKKRLEEKLDLLKQVSVLVEEELQRKIKFLKEHGKFTKHLEK